MKQLYFMAAILFSIAAKSQFYTQLFDGADTSINSAIFVKIDSSQGNSWEIGEPQKTYFNAASTFPNVLITDLNNSYKINETSRFTFVMPDDVLHWNGGVLAIQWNQKLDFDNNRDGGILEYRLLDSLTNPWLPVYPSPYVYNFYGNLQANFDTLANGGYAFTGRDTVWRNIWLCFDVSWVQYHQGLELRFSILSDSIDNHKEGWMIDNLYVAPTFVHTLVENKQVNYLEVSPNPSHGKFTLHLAKRIGFHLIEELSIINSNGKVIQHFENIPSKFDFDISGETPGTYYLRVKTNLTENAETVKIVLLN